MKLVEKLNKSNFVKLARIVHGDKYSYDKSVYTKAKEKVIITCPIHGDFEQRPQDHVLKECGCPKCKTQKIIETHSYTKEDFLKLARNKYQDKYNYDKVNYINFITPIVIICPIHGEFIITPSNHLASATGCPKCGREKANRSETYSKEDFIKKAGEIHFNKYDYSKVDYVKSQEKVYIICPKHGGFWQTPANHLSGQGCPKCRLVGQTKLYNRLKQAFPNLEILFEVGCSKVPWIGNQRLDIYIPKINMAIELMGDQHYKEIPFFKNGSSLELTQKRDIIKRRKCRENNCTLIELQYYYTKEDFNYLCERVTKKLEELEEKYYDEETSQKEKDEYALEAGKLLVEEILYNTQDNTNKLL